MHGVNYQYQNHNINQILKIWWVGYLMVREFLYT
jgi:hypothetical protein